MDTVDSDQETSKFACTKCGKKFKDNRGLQQHYRKKIPCDRKIQCSKCGKVFADVTHLDRHVNDRKTPCEPIVGEKPPEVKLGENKCQFCGRNYISEGRLRQHLQKCKIANNKKVFDGNAFKPGMEVLSEKVESAETLCKELVITRQENRELKEEMSEMKEMLRTLLANQAHANQSVNINHLTIGTMNNNIIINNFYGNQHVESLDPRMIIETLKLDFHKVFPAITELVHGDETLTENHNIYLPNLKTEKVLVWQGDEQKKIWQTTTIREVLPILMKRGVDLLYKADDDLSAIGQLLTDEEGDKFEMLINKQRSKTITDEDIEEIKPILYKMKMLQKK